MSPTSCARIGSSGHTHKLFLSFASFTANFQLKRRLFVGMTVEKNTVTGADMFSTLFATHYARLTTAKQKQLKLF